MSDAEKQDESDEQRDEKEQPDLDDMRAHTSEFCEPPKDRIKLVRDDDNEED